MVEDPVEQVGDGPLSRPGQGKRGDRGGDGSYQTKTVIEPPRLTL
jgi:hypothetical protein